MENDSPSKPSVAELAGRLKGHVVPTPSSNDQMPRRPPCSLRLQHPKNDTEESDKTAASPNPFKVKVRNSPIIEKLQANLALSPTALLPSPKTPEVKLQLAPLSPTTSCSPLSPTLQPEDEDPVSFDSPAEGAALQSINKTRARLSFKRRPPTRQHRRSAGEEAGAVGSGPSPCELSGTEENGDPDQVFPRTAGGDDDRQTVGVGEAEDTDRDGEETEDGAAGSDPDDKEDAEEERTPGQAQSSDAPEQREAEETQEETVQEAQQGGGDEVGAVNV